jgi:phosphoserine phosphatase RsbU/P
MPDATAMAPSRKTIILCSAKKMPPFASPPLGRQKPRRAETFVQLDQFWQRVTEGLALSQLWSQFRSDARASYRLYQHDFDTQVPQGDGSHRFFRRTLDLAWAILEKLSPPRRVLLLVGVLLLIFPAGGFNYEGKNGHMEVFQFDLRFFGGLSIFVVLLLEIADRVVMKRDLEIARDIQSWLLPATAPPVPGLEIAFNTRPANTVAGDFYDVLARPRSPDGADLFLLVIADVAGKSIPAALLMATFHASLRTLAVTPCSLAELVDGMNRYACTNNQGGRRFTTAFLAEYDPLHRSLHYINAGHNAPMLQRSSGRLERMESGGIPLGIQPEAAYQQGSVVLQPNDWLMIFTDGLVEAENQAGEEYGEARVLEVLRAGAAMAPGDLLRQMMTNLDAFVATTPQHDDVTCLVVRVR